MHPAFEINYAIYKDRLFRLAKKSNITVDLNDLPKLDSNSNSAEYFLIATNKFSGQKMFGKSQFQGSSMHLILESKDLIKAWGKKVLISISLEERRKNYRKKLGKFKAVLNSKGYGRKWYGGRWC